MRSQILNALKVSALAIVLSVGLSYVYALNDIPQSQPPGGNLPGFIDIGSTAQKKLGSFGVGIDPVANYGLTAYGTSGLYGLATAGSGVSGLGLIGVTGTSNAAAGSGTGTGVQGVGGKFGIAGNGESYGVLGVATNATGVGISGQGSFAGVYGESAQYGLSGKGTGVNGVGVVATGTIADFYSVNSGIRFPDQTQQITAYSPKVCEFVDGTNFRENFTVSGTWTRADCNALASQNAVSLTNWRVGCIGPHSLVWGGSWGATAPTPNCGWDVPLPPPPPDPGSCGALATWKGLCN